MLTYALPKELIAKRPAEPRDSARLLALERSSGQISHRVFRDIPEFLKPGDCLVLNDTKVIPARLYGKKAVTGGGIELLLLEREEASEKHVIYRCLGQPAKNLRPGTRLVLDHGSIQAEVIAWKEGERWVRFEGRGVEQALYRLGQVPLPPYIDRPVQPEDADWYQTVYARQPGAVAAPTAGLHFTESLLSRLRAVDVRIAFVTLHVGWGTFKPVGEKELASGRLHPERFEVPAETMGAIQEAKGRGGRVIAVGTTVVRTLEAAIGRGEGPATPYPRQDLSGETCLFIRPGFEFKLVDALITNFHLPGTSLLLLVAAFVGEEQIRQAYEEAVQRKYRFYSYGDAMLIT